MAQNLNDMRSVNHYTDRFEFVLGSADPTKDALRRFYWFVSDSEYFEHEDLEISRMHLRDTQFFGEDTTVLCYYDFAHIWLMEGSAIQSCPTYESWLLFLIAFADEVRRHRYNAIGNWTEAFAPYQGLLEENVTFDQLGLMYWSEAADIPGSDRGPFEAQRHFEDERWQHPTLRREVYEMAHSMYRRAELIAAGKGKLHRSSTP